MDDTQAYLFLPRVSLSRYPKGFAFPLPSSPVTPEVVYTNSPLATSGNERFIFLLVDLELPTGPPGDQRHNSTAPGYPVPGDMYACTSSEYPAGLHKEMGSRSLPLHTIVPYVTRISHTAG